MTVRKNLLENGALLQLTIDKPKGNIVTGEVLAALHEELDQAPTTPKVRAVLIDAAGKDFSFGASVEEHRPAQAPMMLKRLHSLLKRMLETPMPVLIAVQGRCLGGAMEVALAGSRIFAAPDAIFGQPEIKLAVFAPAASAMLGDRVGPAAAEDLLITGRTVNAAEALALGLVDEVCDVGQSPTDRAVAYVKKHLLEGSASSLRFAVQASRLQRAPRVAKALDEQERLYVDVVMNTPDAVEGIEAFIAKRPPRWEDSK